MICDCFVEVPENVLWCFCCSYRLRAKPRNLKYKSAMENKPYEQDINKNQAVINGDGTFTYLNNIDENIPIEE